jgi:hypothetical protein
MGKRPGPVEIIWQRGAEAFAFLIDDWDFEGPECTESGIAYHRPDLHVTAEIWAWKREAGISTGGVRVDADAGTRRSADLSCLYVQAGLGPAQHVPEQIGGGHTIAKRLDQHARALRLLMPHLTGPGGTTLFRRCGSGPSASEP